MKITYIGRSTVGITVPVDGAERFVAHGDSVDLPAELAASLLEQDTEWAPVKASPSVAKSPKTKADKAETVAVEAETQED
jgi:hypothetical protein